MLDLTVSKGSVWGWVALWVGLAVAGFGDELTPSGGVVGADTGKDIPRAGVRPISFKEAEAQLVSVIPFELVTFSSVFQNSYNWRGVEDASLQCELGLTPDALVLRGTLRDDHPFFQTSVHPSRPSWWRIAYAGDGIEFLFDDPTSSAQHLQFALNFSSRAVEPRVELLASPLGLKPGFLEAATFELMEPSEPQSEQAKALGGATARFQVAIPLALLAEPKFFNGPLRITLRLHDMDGDPSSYLMMQQVVEKK